MSSTTIRQTFLDSTSLLVVLVSHCLWFPAAQADPPNAKERHPSEGTTVRVAAISFVPTKFDIEKNAQQLESAFRKAGRMGAQIAVAPEGILDGYVVNEIIAGKAPEKKMNTVAIAIDHPLIQRFQKLARELKMCLVFGFAERIESDVFNSAVFIDLRGKLSGKYHKMQFAEGYHRSWWFNRLGKQSRAFDTPYGRCGILICNDRWNPQLARIPVLDGARFLLIPAFGSRSKAQDQAVLNRGRENGVPVVEANVGVSLIVDGGKIARVERQEVGITLGEITIPSAVPVRPSERDRIEKEFLQWREREMPKRYEKTSSRFRPR